MQPATRTAAAGGAVPLAGPRTLRRRHRVAAAVAAIAGVLALAGMPQVFSRTTDAPAAGPVVVVGRIADYSPAAAGSAGPLGDMLATNLARARGLRVVSGARMQELLGRVAPGREPNAADVADVARRSGAAEIVDGAVYALPTGGFRLDLRRVDIANGAVRAAYTVSGPDLFALADSGTARLLDGLGAARPSSSIADITTRSVLAYRLYEQGVRAHARGETRSAEALFASALGEDSLFALAAYYHALSAPTVPAAVARMARARRLGARASDRERLIIEAQWALSNNDPALRFYAESLVARYPLEPQGHLLLGGWRIQVADYAGAIESLQRVVALDSLGIGPDAPHCRACEALAGVASAYLHLDSLAAAERVARHLVALAPQKAVSHASLGYTLALAGRVDEAQAAYRRVGVMDANQRESMLSTLARPPLHRDAYARADSAAASALRVVVGTPARREALWWLYYSQRAQGRTSESIATARTFLGLGPAMGWTAEVDAPPTAYLVGQSLFEAGRLREAAIHFDSAARTMRRGVPRSQQASERVWQLTHLAETVALLGDTARLAQIVDTARALGAESVHERYRRLHHHLRGLLLVRQGRLADAEREFRAAVTSWNLGYSRINLALADVLRRQGRAGEAVRVLQPLMRADLDGASFYVTRTEAHLALADAWREAGGRGAADSAAAHYRAVAAAWARGEGPFAQRAARAAALADSLAPRR